MGKPDVFDSFDSLTAPISSVSSPDLDTFDLNPLALIDSQISSLHTMWFIWLLSWISLSIQICFVTLSLAAGLYYLAELVEEYTQVTSKVIKGLTLSTLLVYFGLFLFEDMSSSMVVGGVVAQVLHLALLRDFPYFDLMSPAFIGAVVMLMVNHYLAFQFFAEEYYIFSEVLAYFTICLWLVPFAFFVSLSANENVLPTMAEKRPLLSGDNDVVSNYFQRREKKKGLLTMFQSLKESLLPTRVKKVF